MGRLRNITRSTEVAQIGRKLTLRVVLVGMLVLVAGLLAASLAAAQEADLESRIIVKKVTNPDGDPQSFGFTSDFAGSFSLSDGQTKASGNLSPGTYAVSELPTAGWTLNSATCNDGSEPGSIDLAAGETVTCTFRNKKQQRGRIIVQKDATPSDTGVSFSFTASYGNFALAHGEQNDSGTLRAGTYSVAENVPAGWMLESATCDDGSAPSSIALDEGETVICRFVNTKPGTVIVKKAMIGGEAAFSFSGTPAGSISTNGGTISAGVSPGTYTSTEAGVDGWALDSIACDDGNSSGNVQTRTATFVAGPGEIVTCTFTNRKLLPPERGTITVRKVTNPAGDEQEFDFQFGDTSFSLADGGSETFDDLEEGTYSVSEDALEGWDLTSATCDNGDGPSEIALGAGDEVVCTFTNTKRGTIIVEKQTSPGGAQGSFTFTGDAAGTIGDGGQLVVSGLEPGTYESTESVAAGWLLTSIECDNEDSSGDVGDRTATFDVGPGETVTCIFTNAQQVTGKGSIDVQKSASPTTLKEPGGQVTYSVRITNTSNVNVTITNVVDDKFGDLDDSGGNGCFDVPINLAPGAFASCQFSRQITGSGGTEHVNIVCADATDEFGNALKDCDDARVTITPRLIDLVIVKEATSPTKLNGTVNYSLTVTNKGPDTATNVVVADPAPAGIQYQSATPSQGTCAVSVSLVTCQLGTLTAGQTVTIAITGKAIAVGTHVNTATVTGDGGRETNPADNTDSAETVVPAPLTPPTKPTKPKPPKVDVCMSLTVTPKMIKADGKADRVVAKVRASTKPMRGVKVLIRGAGIRNSGMTNSKGVAVIVINPKTPGLITITTVGKGDACGARRIGVVGVFLPPVAG